MDNQEEEEMDLTQEVQVIPQFENLLPEEINSRGERNAPLGTDTRISYETFRPL